MCICVEYTYNALISLLMETIGCWKGVCVLAFVHTHTHKDADSRWKHFRTYLQKNSWKRLQFSLMRNGERFSFDLLNCVYMAEGIQYVLISFTLHVEGRTDWIVSWMRVHCLWNRRGDGVDWLNGWANWDFHLILIYYWEKGKHWR